MTDDSPGSAPEDRRRPSAPVLAVVGLVVAQALLALLMLDSHSTADAVAVVAVAVALGVALQGKRVEWAVYAISYVAGLEVLWRMTSEVGAIRRDFVLWESMKVAVAIIALVSGLRAGPDRRTWTLPFVLVVVLTPGVVVTFLRLEFLDAAGEAGFNVAGPISLALCVFFLANTRLSWLQIRRAGWAMVVPICGVATLALSATIGGDARFIQESNVVTSADFSPNQVSSILGLGALLCVMLAVGEPRGALRRIAIVLGLCFFVQSILTFSRGGVFNAVIALAVGGVFVASRRGPRRALMRIALVVGIFLVIVLPMMNRYADGQLFARFTDLNPGSRITIAGGEWELWRENPLLGVGAGMGRFDREPGVHGPQVAHTEYTRLLAEHGTGGVIGIVALVAMAFEAYRRHWTWAAKAFAATMLAWPLTQMLHAATRLAVASVLFGAAAMAIEDEMRWTRGDSNS